MNTCHIDFHEQPFHRSHSTMKNYTPMKHTRYVLLMMMQKIILTFKIEGMQEHVLPQLLEF